MNQSCSFIKNAHNLFTKVKNLDLAFFFFFFFKLNSSWLLFPCWPWVVSFWMEPLLECGRPWNTKVDFVIGSGTKVATTTLDYKFPCICPALLCQKALTELLLKVTVLRLSNPTLFSASEEFSLWTGLVCEHEKGQMTATWCYFIYT